MRRNYSQNFDPAIPGMLSGPFAGYPRIRAYKNMAGGSAEIYTITIPGTPAASTEYDLMADQGKAVFKTDATPTQAELQAGLLNAIRTNPIVSGRFYSEAVSTNVVLTSRQIGFEHSVSSLALTVAKTPGTGAQSVGVPFGRFVGRAAADTDPQSARLIALTTDTVLGITLTVKDLERDAIGTFAKTEFRHSDVMDVLDRTEGCDGVWVETTNEAIAISAIPRISLVAGNEGKVTADTTGATTISLAGLASFQSAQKTLTSGKKVILLSFNLP